jgi:hypothetical protein
MADAPSPNAADNANDQAIGELRLALIGQADLLGTLRAVFREDFALWNALFTMAVRMRFAGDAAERDLAAFTARAAAECTQAGAERFQDARLALVVAARIGIRRGGDRLDEDPGPVGAQRPERQPGTEPPGWVCADTTGAPQACSMPARTAPGTWSQANRVAGGREPGRAAIWPAQPAEARVRRCR